MKPPCPTCLQFQDFIPSSTTQRLFLNPAQSVTVNCPDGSTPTVQIPAGVVGYLLSFEIGNPPYPDLILNCAGSQIVVPVPDNATGAELENLINQMLGKCAGQIGLQIGCKAGEFVNEKQTFACSDNFYVGVPGALPSGVSVSSDTHSLIARAGLISSTISVEDANLKAVQLLKEIFATRNAVCSATPIPPAPDPDLLWYKFPEGSGSTTVDFSVAGNDGQNIGGNITWSTGPTGGGALAYTGTIAGVEGFHATNPATWGATDFSYSIWVQPTGTPSSGNFYDLIQSHTNLGGTMNLAIDSSNDIKFQAVTHTNSGGAGTVVPGAWQMITITYNSSTGLMTFYLNGVSKGTSTIAGPFADSGEIDIGCQFAVATNSLAGKLADVRIWSTQLTADDVANLYANGAQ